MLFISRLLFSCIQIISCLRLYHLRYKSSNDQAYFED